MVWHRLQLQHGPVGPDARAVSFAAVVVAALLIAIVIIPGCRTQPPQLREARQLNAVFASLLRLRAGHDVQRVREGSARLAELVLQDVEAVARSRINDKA